MQTQRTTALVAREISLPTPTRVGRHPLESCLELRRSVRVFYKETMAIDDVGQLLWAAQGITGAEGNRAAPSAGATYPLHVFLAAGRVDGLPPGVYRYISDSHEIRAVSSDDIREALAASARQEWMSDAAVIVCIAANFQRTESKYGARGHNYVFMEAGAAAENLMLEAVALGLGTTLVGAFDDDEVAKLYGLTTKERPICMIPIGKH